MAHRDAADTEARADRRLARQEVAGLPDIVEDAGLQRLEQAAVERLALRRAERGCHARGKGIPLPGRLVSACPFAARHAGPSPKSPEQIRQNTVAGTGVNRPDDSRASLTRRRAGALLL